MTSHLGYRGPNGHSRRVGSRTLLIVRPPDEEPQGIMSFAIQRRSCSVQPVYKDQWLGFDSGVYPVLRYKAIYSGLV
jgi:hypothetical protein